MGEVYTNDHKHIENPSDNEETSTGNYKRGYMSKIHTHPI